MHARLKSRIARIEKALPKPARERVEPAAPLIAAWLAARGFLPGPNESLAETWARAMGISSRQLRAELHLRAAGLS
jgi:hypothetical protein